uniref:Uncharacterized protein n=1 Tax=Daphnia galeata TaxID=27404 RepID=A0A8J2RPP7_9CRUS|nr:unnamed protein product [Daphnia galeata]
MAAFEWDCDCGWSEWDLDSTEWTTQQTSSSASSSKPSAIPPPPPPPFFDLPPPPLPPSLQPPPELCSSSVGHPLGLETCQAFLVSDAERQIPVDSSSSAATIFITAAVLTITFVIIGFVAWRLRKQKLNQKALLRCQQKTINGTGGVGVGGGMMDGVPALLQGLNGRQVASGAGVNDDEDGVFYDELISYPPQFRAPNHPPAYEMKDVLLESTSPCHCTAHPLLGNGSSARNVRNGGCNALGPRSALHCQQQPHYVTSPYRCGSHSPPSSTTPTIDDQHDCSWITEPVYEELPSGPEEDGRFSRDHQRSRHRNDSVSINDSLRSQRGGSAYQRPSNYSNWSGEEPGETDFFLPPSTWYHQQTQHSTPILKGHMTTHGPVGQGRGGIRAAWREMEPSSQQQQRTRGTSSSASQSNSARRKRKVKSMKNPGGVGGGGGVVVGSGLEILDNQNLHYHCTGLYRGICPPEEPPFIAGENDHPIASLLDQDSPVPSEQLSTPTKTQPRYYYYSESDDYGVMNQPSRTLSNSRRGAQQQRHLSRIHRTLQPRSPTSVDNKNVGLN